MCYCHYRPTPPCPAAPAPLCPHSHTHCGAVMCDVDFPFINCLPWLDMGLSERGRDLIKEMSELC